MSTPSRVAAGVPTGGQFAASAHAESGVSLVEQPVATPILIDSRGDEVEVEPGLIEENAEYVFTNGQCVALAIVLAERTGWPLHLRTVGADPDSLRHVAVLTPAGDLLDIDGPNDAVIVAEMDADFGDSLPPQVLPADQARTLLNRFDLPPQDLDVARTFVEPVLALNSELTSAVPTGPVTSSRTRPAYDGLDDIAAAGYVVDEWERWQRGDCAAYAIALIEASTHLRFGVMGSTELGNGDASAGWRESHFFAHDDTHAYDSAGRHPLPYLGIRADSDYAELDGQIDWYFDRDEYDDDTYAAARAHAERHGIRTRDPIPLGGHR